MAGGKQPFEDFPDIIKPEDKEEIAKKFTEELKTQKPKMIFSVIGDSDSFVPKPWPKSKFKSALITAVKNAGDSWIFDGGKETGVSGIVYEAWNEYDILEFHDEGVKTTEAPFMRLIGIRPKSNKGRKASSSDNDFIDLQIDAESEKYNEVLVFLENYLSDNGRTSFEEVNLKLSVPILIVVLEGDINTIKHVTSAVKETLSVVIVQGTGKAADLIVECLQCDDIDTMLKTRAPLLFGTSFDENILKEVTYCMEVISRHKWLIRIFNIYTDDPKNLSQIAGEAIICGWSMKKVCDPNAPQIKKSDAIKQSGAIKESDAINTTTKEELIKESEIQSVTKCVSSYNNEEQDESRDGKRRYVLDAKFTSPSSLPLYFYFEYQILQEPSDKSNDTQTKERQKWLLLEALKANRTDYVQVLTDEGVMINIENLKDLYRTTVTCQSCSLKKHINKDKCFHMQWILSQKGKWETKTLLEEGNADEARKAAMQLCRKLLEYTDADESKEDRAKNSKENETFRDKRKGSEVSDLEINTHISNEVLYSNSLPGMVPSLVLPKQPTPVNSQSDRSQCTGVEIEYDPKEGDIDKSTQTDEKCKAEDTDEKCKAEDTDEKCKAEDLLLWSIYANRPEIAETMWQKCENHLLSGLVCAALLKKLSKKADKVKEQQLSDSLSKHSTLFQNRCLMIMEKIYEYDPEVTIKIVDGSAEVWGITTCPMTFAHDNKMYDIVAHTGCQKALNRKWYNGLPPDFWPFCKSCGSETANLLTAPYFRYMINYFFFITMLVAYTSYVMTSIDDDNYTRPIARLWEYYTYFWCLGDFVEEVIRLTNVCRNPSHRKFWSIFKQYIYDFWNTMDVASYVLLITALFVRHLLPSEDYNIARRLFSLSLLSMYLRFLQIFFINRRLGSQLIMIKEMLKDLLYFLCIAIFIIISVGVYYHAHMFPNHLALFGPGSYQTWSIWKIFYYPYWQLYGELNLEYLEGKDTSDCLPSTEWHGNQTQERCPEKEWSVPVVAAFYMLITNLLLVNLVIAMFSYTFDAVQANSEKLWRFQHYTVVTDYERKIPSPLNLVFRIKDIMTFICKCRSTCIRNNEEISDDEVKQREYLVKIQKIFAGQCRDTVE